MRLWNTKENAHEEAIKGMLRVNPDALLRLPTQYGYGLYGKNLPEKQVRIIINGGGGYGPMWAGFVGEGLADAMVHGDFDSAPNAYVLYEMAKKIEDGRGVLLLTNHFMGDYLNNDMAVELLEHDGIEAKACYVTDDILSAQGEPKENRSGLHGIAQISKIAAEAAARGSSLEEVFRLVQKANERLRSVSVNISDGRMLLGEGFSGEPAVHSEAYVSVTQMAEVACELLLGEMNQWSEEAFYLSVNPNCSVGYTEGFVILEVVARELQNHGIRLHGCAVGTYFDVFEKTGCMISLLACDEELQRYLQPRAGYGFVV